MRELSHKTLPNPSQERAVVVFLRPERTAPDTLVTIVDGTGSLVGDSVSRSCFSRSLAAGHHLFVAKGENLGVLEAELEAGKTYFVEVAVGVGVRAVRTHLFAIRKGGGEQSVVRGLSSCTFYEPLLAIADRDAKAQAGEIATWIRRAKVNWLRYSAVERERRTLRREDGR